MASLSKVILNHPFHENYCAESVLMTSQFEVIASHVDGLANRTLNHAKKLVSMMNFFNPESELSQLNAAEKNTWHSVSRPLFKVLSIAKQMELESNGMFRVDFEGMKSTPDGEHGFELNRRQEVRLQSDTLLNLGGIGKGFIVDQCFEFAQANGAQDIFVNGGGDIRAKSTSHPWKIALMNPYKQQLAYGHINVMNNAVVTSGTYAKSVTEKGDIRSHFFECKTKEYIKTPKFDAVTVEGPSAALAEIYAKCLLMGAKYHVPSPYRGIAVDAETKRVRLVA